MLIWILLATTLGGLLSAAMASLFLLFPERQRDRLLPHLISFATGAMLAAAWVGLIPEAVHAVASSLESVRWIGASVLAGIVLFFLLEKLVLWRHHHPGSHEPSHEESAHAAGWIVLIGDAIHNGFDGVLIAAAFLADTRLGVVTTLAITAHEIPQELGDLAVLLHARMSVRRALLFNVASSLTSILGGLIGYFALHSSLAALPYAVCLAAASLMYVAMADLIPTLHRRAAPRESLIQLLLILGGIATIAAAERWLG